MDIQYIGDSGMVISIYVSGYTTKAERSHLQDQFEHITNNKSVASNLVSLVRSTLSSKEQGPHECHDSVAGDPLYGKSVTVQYVDVSMPHKCSRRIKTLKELEKMDPDSEEIFMPNLLSTHYPQRPEELEDVCLHDFVANYDWQSKDKAGNRKYRKLTKPRLVNHKEFDPNKADKMDDYYYSLILLFVPFRDENSLLKENETPKEAFHRLLDDNESCLTYHKRLQDMLNAKSTVKKIYETRKEGTAKQEETKQDDDMQIVGEVKSAMQVAEDMDVNPINTFSLQERVEMLNADQRRVYETITSQLAHQKEHDNGKCHCGLKPLRIFVSGVGGTGKSFLIETVKAFADNSGRVRV